MTVYIVVRSDWRSDTIMAVYLDKNAAEQHAANITKHQVFGSVVTKEIQE